MSSWLQANCNFCDELIEHQYEKHIFNTQNPIEECKFYKKSIKHHKEHHNEVKIKLLDKFSLYGRIIIKVVLKDILGIIIFPFGLFVSVIFKVFEWLNNKIGIFD